MKKVIAFMTVGKDVSMLFTDVVNCIQTQNIELKKLVYLYLINYAKSQPDLAILAVNTFVKDPRWGHKRARGRRLAHHPLRARARFCSRLTRAPHTPPHPQDTMDPNPLIRALAVRTMGCIRVDKIVEYLVRAAAQVQRQTDPDPYVRKTAAVCVAKLYDINGELVEDQGFLDMVYDRAERTRNPMVVSNAVASLAEISETSDMAQKVFQINTATLQKMLAALNECTEWGQVFIPRLARAIYRPSGRRRARGRVHHRARHAAAAARQLGRRALGGQGDDQVHGPHHVAGRAQGALQEDGAAAGDAALVGARDPVRVAAQHQPDRAEAAVDPRRTRSRSSSASTTTRSTSRWRSSSADDPPRHERISRNQRASSKS